MTTPPARWVDAQARHTEKQILIQKLFRGWRVRRRLRMSGPGVLRRSECVNEEDLATLDDIRSIHPGEQFGLLENGKTWGFHVCTLLQIMATQMEPENPQTKVPLDMDTRKRLRKIWHDRSRRKLPLFQIPQEDNVRCQLIRVCQNLAENGIDELRPQHWEALDVSQAIRFLFRLHNTFYRWSLEPPQRSWRAQQTRWIRDAVESCHDRHPSVVLQVTARICNVFFAREVQAPEIAFQILTAWVHIS